MSDLNRVQIVSNSFLRLFKTMVEDEKAIYKALIKPKKGSKRK